MFSYFWNSELHLAALGLAFESVAAVVELFIAAWTWSLRHKHQTPELEHRREMLETAFSLGAAIFFIVAVCVSWRIVVLQSRSAEEQDRMKTELQNLKEFAGPRHLTDANMDAIAQAVAKIAPVHFEVQFCPTYMYLTENDYQPDVVEAISFAHPVRTTDRNILKALLFCRGLRVRKIAEWMGLREQVVDLFQELFFNIHDRISEPGYIASILYPRGKMSPTQDPGLELMRLGYDHGCNAVAAHAVLPESAVAREPVESLHEEYEYLTMRNAVFHARTGRLNAESPWIKHANSLGAVRKKNRETGQTPDEIMGLGAISAGQAIMDTVMKIQAPDIQDRRERAKQILQQEEEGAKASKTD